MKRCAFLVAVLAALAGGAPAARAADSPQCTAAKQRVTQIQNEITKLNKQLPNKDASINKVRQHQIAVRKARLEKDLAAAKKAVAKACGSDVSAYDGAYKAQFVQIALDFNVVDGVISGELVSVKPIDPKTGIAVVRANFLDATCGDGGTFPLVFNAKAGTATATNLTCKLGGLPKTVPQVVGKRT